MTMKSELSAIEEYCGREVVEAICSRYRIDCHVERRIQMGLYVNGVYEGLCLTLPDEAKEEIRFISLLATAVWTEKVKESYANKKAS